MPVIGAVLAAIVAIYLWRCKRTKDGKDVFGLFMREKTTLIPKSDIASFYRATKTDIHIAVGRVWHFHNARRRLQLDHLWKEYDEIQTHELDTKYEGVAGDSYRRLGERLQYDVPQDPCLLIRFYLEEFYKFAA